MKILLDTHVIIWVLVTDHRLSQTAVKLIQDFQNAIYISPVSIAEIGIKESKGKLKIPEGYVDILFEEGYEELPLKVAHALQLSRLLFHHSDPFDRLLISQAMTEDLSIMTNDAVFSQYEVSLIPVK